LGMASTLCPEAVHRQTNLDFNNLRIDQGQLVALVGRSCEGKSTLLRLIGGAQLPHADDDPLSRFLMPSHARVLHVASEPLFIRRGLYANLTLGVSPGHPDGAIDRVKVICRLVGLPSKVVDSIQEAGTEHNFHEMESLSTSEKRCIVMARTFIANPDILCIHDPTLHLNASHAESIMALLRDMVDQRGLAVKDVPLLNRRPRTCVFTSTRALCIRYAQATYMVDRSKGVYPVEMKHHSEPSVDSFSRTPA